MRDSEINYKASRNDDCTDAGDRATQEQLPRLGKGGASFCAVYLPLPSRARRYPGKDKLHTHSRCGHDCMDTGDRATHGAVADDLRRGYGKT